MEITSDFTLEEMTHSDVAIRHGIDNRPDEQQLAALVVVASEILQPARDALGPIRVTSGFRCPAVNRLVGGAASSQHQYGEAVDLRGVNVPLRLLMDWFLGHSEFDQLIFEFESWVHVSKSRRHADRREALTSYHEGGAVRYRPYR